MKGYSITLMAGLICCLASSTFAGLDWDTHRIRHVASVTEDKAEVAFTFTNTGDQPVTITTVRTSCGCTTATLNKETYDPGETGEVTAVFAFGDRTGKQHKRITVRTSTLGEDGKPIMEDTALYLRVTIPQPVKLRPRVLVWKQGEELKPKSIQVSINHNAPVKLGEPAVEGQAVTAELKEVEPGKQYELILTPSKDARPIEPVAQEVAIDTSTAANEEAADAVKSTVSSEHGKVKLEVAFGEDVSRTYTALARVIRPEPEASACCPSESTPGQAADTQTPSATDAQVAILGVDGPAVATDAVPAP